MFSTVKLYIPFLKYLRKRIPLLILLFILILGSTVLLIITPLILEAFLKNIRMQFATGLLLPLALLFLLLAVARPILSLWEAYLGDNISLLATNELRVDLTLHCLALDLRFHTQHTPGELVERVDGQVATLNNLFSRLVLSLISNGVLLIGIIGMIAFTIHALVGLVLALFTIFSIVIVYMLHSKALPLWKEARKQRAEMISFTEERLSGLEDLTSSGAQSYVLRELASQSRAILRTFLRGFQAIMRTRNLLRMFFDLGTVVALLLGVLLFWGHAIPLERVYTLFYYTTLLQVPVEQIVEQWRSLQQGSGSIANIHELLAEKSTIHGGDRPLASEALEVAFERVSFQYIEDTYALQDLSFVLPAGKTLGLLGQTGSGKSTVARLLTRLYQPQSGTILLNGHPIQDYALADLRRAIGIITQEVHIFNATVRDNLTLFDDSISDDVIAQALEQLKLTDWLKRLPEGLDTVLSSREQALSAGEAQLLSLARLFLRNPQVIILDEASSRIDPATEQLLDQALKQLLQGRTAIIIAHRLQTVMQTDLILVLENGRCREFGEREALLQQPDSAFATMYRLAAGEVRQ